MKNDFDPTEKTVLVVDDDQYICIFLQTILEKEGFKVDLASNGEEALNLVRNKSIDFIVLDWMMPVLSGFDVLKALRKDEERHIPVMVITAHVSDQETIDMILNEMHAADFMTKPVDHKNFIKHVHRILKTSPPKEKIKG
jgi:DNA-binding response OmpR family regulator